MTVTCYTDGESCVYFFSSCLLCFLACGLFLNSFNKSVHSWDVSNRSYRKSFNKRTCCPRKVPLSSDHSGSRPQAPQILQTEQSRNTSTFSADRRTTHIHINSLALKRLHCSSSRVPEPIFGQKFIRPSPYSQSNTNEEVTFTDPKM